MGRWDYPKSRRILLQAVLCIILGGSVALAAVVSRHRKASPSVAFLPNGWVVDHSKDDSVLFAAHQELAGGVKARELVCRQKQMADGSSLMDFITVEYLNDPASKILSADTDGDGLESITIAGLPGVLFAVQRQQSADINWIACCASPAGEVLSLVLKCPATDNPDVDRQLLRNIARRIEIHP